MPQSPNLEVFQVKTYIIKLPQSTEFDVKSFSEFLKTLSRILKNVPFSFSLNVINKRIFYSFQAPAEHSTVLENQLYAVFPKVEIEEVKFDLSSQNPQNGAKTILSLKYSDFFPFLTHDKFEGSFLLDMFNQFSRLAAQDFFQLRLKVKPVDYDRMAFNIKRSIGLSVRNTKDSFNVFRGFLSKKSSPQVRRKALSAAQEKNRQPLFLCEGSITVFSENRSIAQAKLAPVAQAFGKLESEFNEFSSPILPITPADLADVQSLILGRRALYLSADEISTIYHFPPDTNAVPNLYKILAPKAEPPLGLSTADNTPKEEICLFAKTNYRNINEEFGIKRRDRARHMYIVGKSGVGKSKLQEILIKNDFEAGEGVCVIDPHGDLIENVIPYIPQSRVKDVIYFNAIDEKHPISFNPIEKVEKVFRQQVATGLIEIFKKSFGANWSPRLEHVLRMTLLALLDAPKASVMSILLLLTDRDFRQETIKTIEDQVVKNFWTNEFASWSEKFDSEAIMPILNKIGQFVSDSLIRNIVSQEENKLKMADIMNSKKILLIKLPKGVLGEENASLLGSMVVTKLYQAALGRSELPESERVPFYLYVDEFQNFATDSFANILSESRKYKLSLAVAHQYISQLSDVVKKTVFGNVGTIISFRIGPEDATFLEREFEPRFRAVDITNLGVREIYLKMSIDDEIKEPFSAKTLELAPAAQSFKEEIVAHTRENYCRRRDVAEEEIKKGRSKEMEVLEKLKNEDFSAPIL